MKKILVIGSTCVDIILKLDHLPVTGEDLHPKSQSMALGGCACNAAHVLLYSGSEFTFLSPVGGGIYGDLVKEALTAHGFSIPVYLPEKENGCCYCLVEASGERTFLSLHGVEYTFRKEWMEPYRMEDYSMAYLCGLEVEEPTGEALVEYFEAERGPKLFFAPGPRGTRLPGERLNRILALSPVLHINEQEALELGGRDCVADAAAALYQITGSPVIVTLGERGAYCRESAEHAYVVPGIPSRVVDTIGAGDSHIGAILAGLQKGSSLRDAIAAANQVAAAVVSQEGAILPKDSVLFRNLRLTKEGLRENTNP